MTKQRNLSCNHWLAVAASTLILACTSVQQPVQQQETPRPDSRSTSAISKDTEAAAKTDDQIDEGFMEPGVQQAPNPDVAPKAETRPDVNPHCLRFDYPVFDQAANSAGEFVVLGWTCPEKWPSPQSTCGETVVSLHRPDFTRKWERRFDLANREPFRVFLGEATGLIYVVAISRDNATSSVFLAIDRAGNLVASKEIPGKTVSAARGAHHAYLVTVKDRGTTNESRRLVQIRLSDLTDHDIDFPGARLVEALADGRVYVAGDVKGSIRLLGKRLRSRGFRDIYIAILEGIDRIKRIKQIGGKHSEFPYDLAKVATESENGPIIALTGHFNHSLKINNEWLRKKHPGADVCRPHDNSFCDEDTLVFLMSSDGDYIRHWHLLSDGWESGALHIDDIEGSSGRLFILSGFAEPGADIGNGLLPGEVSEHTSALAAFDIENGFQWSMHHEDHNRYRGGLNLHITDNTLRYSYDRTLAVIDIERPVIQCDESFAKFILGSSNSTESKPTTEKLTEPQGSRPSI